jgi:hypothetical protein
MENIMKLTVENLKHEIIAKEGLVISEATLKVEDLLSTYYQLIKNYHLSDTRWKKFSLFLMKNPLPITISII